MSMFSGHLAFHGQPLMQAKILSAAG